MVSPIDVPVSKLCPQPSSSLVHWNMFIVCHTVSLPLPTCSLHSSLWPPVKKIRITPLFLKAPQKISNSHKKRMLTCLFASFLLSAPTSPQWHQSPQFSLHILAQNTSSPPAHPCSSARRSDPRDVLVRPLFHILVRSQSFTCDH